MLVHGGGNPQIVPHRKGGSGTTQEPAVLDGTQLGRDGSVSYKLSVDDRTSLGGLDRLSF